MTPTRGRPDAVAAIDRLIGPARWCAQCRGPMTDSPDDEFCSETCQNDWRARPLRLVTEPDPGADPDGSVPVLDVDPAELLDRITAFLTRFSVFPDAHCAPTIALWCAHTHTIANFYTTPRLILDSAEPGSGKTRVLEVCQFLVAKPEMTISITTAAIFRMLAAGPVTLLFDEIDAVFSAKSGGNHEDLRALLNAGYKRSATVARCVGDASRMRVERFPVFAPVALAGIAGGMPSTITTRAITVHMRRRAPHEHAEPFRERKVEAEATPMREALTEWLDRVGADYLAGAEPAIPDGVTDRAAEVWEPLLAIAELAGGHWPETARAAATHFVTTAGRAGSSTGTRLLADLRTVFTTAGTDRISTRDILTALHDLDEAPWGDLDGRPLDARRLATALRIYDVRPGPIRIAGAPDKGYQIDGPIGLADAWLRYLPPPDPDVTATGPPGDPSVSVTAVTSVTPQVRGVTDTEPVTAASVTPPVEHPTPHPPHQDHVTDVSVTPHPSVTPLTCDVTAVTDVTATDGTED